MFIYSYICFLLVKLLFDTYNNIQLYILLHILAVYRKQILMKSIMKENTEIKKKNKRKKKGNTRTRKKRKKERKNLEIKKKIRKKKEKELRN